MPMRPEYLLAQSEFNDFLFAFVADEKNDQDLTVISLLARLDLNPWEEAARLSELLKRSAIDELAAMIARESSEDLQPSDPQSIATRLVGFLPKHRAQPARPKLPNTVQSGEPRSVVREIVKWLVFALAVIIVAWSLTAD